MQLVDQEEMDMSDSFVKYYGSNLICQLCQTGLTRLVKSWNAHRIPDLSSEDTFVGVQERNTQGFASISGITECSKRPRILQRMVKTVIDQLKIFIIAGSQLIAGSRQAVVFIHAAGVASFVANQQHRLCVRNLMQCHYVCCVWDAPLFPILTHSCLLKLLESQFIISLLSHIFNRIRR
ncbi:hypothetical protein DNTS_013800 [Danionella cerebrum]|uniref:Uncharacterized protein n=1 Tax=Danionella cerebrum TaxID=2873325 RepID=A0A553P9H4_9TELE|nr:hypothetical protein DNTS_013800 [Danionella translucida]